jgi:hypothetical protein
VFGISKVEWFAFVVLDELLELSTASRAGVST